MPAFMFDADCYSKVSTHQKQWGSRLIDEFALTGSEAVLDLGCGEGVLTARLAERVPDGHVVGIDASPTMIDAARRLERSNLRFELRDIDALDGEAMFDVIFSNAALHWIKDHERLLRRVRRLMRPGGVARFNFGAAGNCGTFCRVAREILVEPPFRDAFAGFVWPWFFPEIDGYRAIAEQTGFADVEVRGEVADRAFPNAEAMIGWIDQPSLVPFLAHRNPRLGEAFRERVIHRMIAATRRPDGTCFEAFRRIDVRAVR